LYNGMIAPLGRYDLRGVLWYQGESNTGEAERYGDLLRTLSRDWRIRFGAELPVLVAQLANYGTPPVTPSDSGWARLREAQRQFTQEDPRTALAVTIDIGDRYDIHPPNKQELGRRLARAARHTVYGEQAFPSGPVPVSVRREGAAIVVRFGDVSEALVAYGANGPVGFELCGATQASCRYATGQIRGQEVVLHAALEVPATRVRYGWADNPVVTLFDRSGVPAGPFETAIP
jgi:sialate O-acetylesterase